MSLHNGPIRPGARGGRGEFSWDKVKGDQDASYYIGHSVKALSGRWQKGKDVYWYTRGKAGQGMSVEEERRAVKQREEELMLEALGLKPKSQPVEHAPMDQKELDAIIKKNAPEREEGAQQDAIKGLGFAPGATIGGGVAVHTRLEGMGVETAAPPQGQGVVHSAAGPSGMPADLQRLPPPPPLPPGQAAAAAAAGGVLTKDQIKQLAKVDKKAAKAAKKARKKVKREAKRAKKERKQAKKLQGLKRGRDEGEEKEGMGGRRQEAVHKHTHAGGSSSSSSSGSEGASSSSSGSEDEGRRVRRGAGRTVSQPRAEDKHAEPRTRPEIERRHRVVTREEGHVYEGQGRGWGGGEGYERGERGKGSERCDGDGRGRERREQVERDGRGGLSGRGERDERGREGQGERDDWGRGGRGERNERDRGGQDGRDERDGGASHRVRRHRHDSPVERAPGPGARARDAPRLDRHQHRERSREREERHRGRGDSREGRYRR